MVQDWLVTHLGWFYTAVVAVFFLFIIFLAFSRFAHIRLPDDALPDYSYVSWIAMLFSAGIGIGLLFFGVCERRNRGLCRSANTAWATYTRCNTIDIFRFGYSNLLRPGGDTGERGTELPVWHERGRSR